MTRVLQTVKMTPKEFSRKRQNNSSMQVDIGGCLVMCINSKKHFVVAVDTHVVSFISNWLMPLAQESARILALDKCGRISISPPKPRASKKQEDSQTSDVSSGFTFTQNMTPNIKDKVYWIPSKHSWKVKAQTRVKDGPFTEMFVVDDDLKGEDFLTMKAGKYLLAVNGWNDSDKSKRQ